MIPAAAMAVRHPGPIFARWSTSTDLHVAAFRSMPSEAHVLLLGAGMIEHIVDIEEQYFSMGYLMRNRRFGRWNHDGARWGPAEHLYKSKGRGPRKVAAEAVHQ